MLLLIFLMDGARTDLRTHVVLGNVLWRNGSARIPKALFLSYCAYEPLIQLTGSDTLRAWPKFEGFSGVMAEKTS